MSLKPPPLPIYYLRNGKLGGITSLCFRKDKDEGNLLYSGCTNGNITTWNLKNFRISSLNNGHDGEGILWIGCHENRLFSQGRDGFIRGWSSDIMTECDKTYSTKIGFCKCSISENGNIVIPTEKANELLLKSTKTGLNNNELIVSYPEKNSYGLCMCLKVYENSSSVAVILAGYENGNLIQWDSRNNKTPLLNENIHKEPFMCLDFDDKKLRGVSGSSDEQFCVWDLSEEIKKTQKCITNPGIASVKIRQDGRLLGIGGWDSRIRIFSWKSLKPLAVLDFHTKTVQCIDFSKESVENRGILMAAGSNDEKISLWNLYGNVQM